MTGENLKKEQGAESLYSWRHAVRLSKEYTAKIVAKEMGFKLLDLESKIQNLKAPLNHTKILNKEKLAKKPSRTNDPFIKIPDALLNSLHVEKYPSQISVNKKSKRYRKMYIGTGSQ